MQSDHSSHGPIKSALKQEHVYRYAQLPLMEQDSTTELDEFNRKQLDKWKENLWIPNGWILPYCFSKEVLEKVGRELKQSQRGRIHLFETKIYVYQREYNLRYQDSSAYAERDTLMKEYEQLAGFEPNSLPRLFTKEEIQSAISYREQEENKHFIRAVKNYEESFEQQLEQRIQLMGLELTQENKTKWRLLFRRSPDEIADFSADEKS